MKYIIINEKKLIIFWSPKCGCTTLKTIISIYFNINNDEKYKHIHLNEELKKKINVRNKNIDIYKDYSIVMLIRNPYERLVSGFINKYVQKKDGKTSHFKNPTNCNNFYDFCNILLKNPKKIDKHHFEKQTSDNGWYFYNELRKPYVKYILDTSNINDISKILGLSINTIKNNSNNKYSVKSKRNKLWLMNYEELNKNKKLNYSDFYNNELKNLVYKIYKDDFIFFSNNLNINFTI